MIFCYDNIYGYFNMIKSFIFTIQIKDTFKYGKIKKMNRIYNIFINYDRVPF